MDQSETILEAFVKGDAGQKKYLLEEADAIIEAVRSEVADPRMYVASVIARASTNLQRPELWEDHPSDKR